MKKLILTLAIAFLPFMVCAQSGFDKFEDNKDVTTVVVTKSAFELMVKFGDTEETKQLAEIAKDIYELRIFTTEKSEIAKQMNKEVNAYLKKANLNELMRVKDKQANVKIYIKEGVDPNHVSELLMFVDSAGVQSQAVILSLTGNIDINKMSELIKELEQMKK